MWISFWGAGQREQLLNWYPLVYDEGTHDWFTKVAEEQDWPVVPIHCSRVEVGHLEEGAPLSRLSHRRIQAYLPRLMVR